jgi:hypothetical protein
MDVRPPDIDEDATHDAGVGTGGLQVLVPLNVGGL